MLGDPRMDPENSDIDGRVLGAKPFNVAGVDVSPVNEVVLLVSSPARNQKKVGKAIPGLENRYGEIIFGLPAAELAKPGNAKQMGEKKCEKSD